MSSDFLAQFGRAVRKLREQRELTQAELAELIGLSRTSITNLEGGRQNLTLSVLPDLANALGVEMPVLMAAAAAETRIAAPDSVTGQIKDDSLRRWVDQVIAEPAAPTGVLVGCDHPPSTS